MSIMLLIYGATGYTGGLIARMFAEQGDMPFMIAGRNAEKLKPLAKELNVAYRAFSLESPQLDDISILLNCASPFKRTSKPLVEACILAKVHYLDITGEIEEMQIVQAYDSQARATNVMLMPGVGFGVVPTDCMAAQVAQQMPNATHLTIAFGTIGGVSQGTLETVIAGIHQNGYQRYDGRLVSAKPAEKQMLIDFGRGEQPVVLNPWRGDIVTAYQTTGIPNIETYAAFPSVVQSLMRARWLHTLWGSAAFQSFLRWVFKRLPPGPSEKELNEGYTFISAEARRGTDTVSAILTGPEAYRFTGFSAHAVVRQISEGTGPIWIPDTC
jgi:short subunit dehydrogenase-like uncharacterized protein